MEHSAKHLPTETIVRLLLESLSGVCNVLTSIDNLPSDGSTLDAGIPTNLPGIRIDCVDRIETTAAKYNAETQFPYSHISIGTVHNILGPAPITHPIQ